jgi:signal peptidase I
MAWKQTLLTMVLAILAALVVRHFLVTAYRVPTGSMQPTLKPGDFIFSYRRAYGWWGEGRLPERGDLVVFSYPQQPRVNYVKRVLALPGDRLEMVDNRLVLNGQPLAYREVTDSPRDNPQADLFSLLEESIGDRRWVLIVEKNSQGKSFGPLIVPPGEIFLLGDNRDTSDDSRYWGTVPVDQVSGQAWVIWLSLSWGDSITGARLPQIRWERLFQPLH